ncbi:DUF4136 domain-containing protein [Novosphingobium sp. 1949]|uniref:DUF4136 domain-containing protein n=1 Tax=Novosphingobium organovorum TaxID=2930092 RepID=A0ABT0BD52_9SPHN|nr:DUF4136 domain-containing protein [Novosphingobium organovorum]MCJ2182983.1 DUF4136 domain-containing protein [Novosphingobium organovorum]
MPRLSLPLPFPSGVPAALRALPVLGALALLGACATTPAAGPVEVTRFHRMDTPAAMAPGTIRILPATGHADTPEFRLYAAAIAQELEKDGYRAVPADTPQSARVAHLTLERDHLEPRRRGSRVSLGGNGGVSDRGSGVGLGIGIDLSPPPPAQIATRLSLTIDDGASGERVWEGRAAQTVTAKSDLAAPAASAPVMARALLKDFPGKSGQTILVK